MFNVRFPVSNCETYNCYQELPTTTQTEPANLLLCSTFLLLQTLLLSSYTLTPSWKPQRTKFPDGNLNYLFKITLENLHSKCAFKLKIILLNFALFNFPEGNFNLHKRSFLGNEASLLAEKILSLILLPVYNIKLGLLQKLLCPDIYPFFKAVMWLWRKENSIIDSVEIFRKTESCRACFAPAATRAWSQSKAGAESQVSVRRLL